jgi:hypothetical protein
VLSLYKDDQKTALVYTARATKAPDADEWAWMQHAQVQRRAGAPAACLKSLAEGRKLRKPQRKDHAIFSIYIEVACLADAGKKTEARKLLATRSDEELALLRGPLPDGIPPQERRAVTQLRDIAAPLAPAPRAEKKP